MSQDPAAFDLLALKPDDTPDYMIPAWVGCVSWASKQPELLDRFRATTNWQPPRTGMDKLIDEATGADRVVATAFVRWVNEHIWGSMDGKREESD